MSGKKVAFGTRPTKPTEANVAPPSQDEWVEARGAQTKRLTLEIPAELHKRVKSQCAARGMKMIDEITALLDKHYPRQG